MSFAVAGVVGLVLYLMSVALLAEVARRARRGRSPADHFLAGRGLGTFVLFLTMYATAYSGNSLLGYPGEAYRRGFSWIMATGFMLAIIVIFHLLVPRLRPLASAHGFVSPGDWIRHRFGGEPGSRALLIGVGALMSVALLNFLLAQLIAMGHVTAQITGGMVPYGAGVAGLAAAILVYETIGGMRAVAWTDALQGVLMLVGLGILLGWLLGEAGGIEGVTLRIAAARPEAVAVPGARECAYWASSTILMGVASVVYPQAIQRIFAAGSAAALRRSLAMMSFMPLATTAVVTFVGLATIPLFAELGRVEADTVMPRLLEEWGRSGTGPTVLAVLVFLGALAAIMSTADSVLLSLGSVIAGDILGRSGTDERTTVIGKRAATVLMAALVIVALEPRITLWRLIELKMDVLIQCAPAFLVAIHWSGMRARPAVTGIAVGTAIAAIGVIAGYDLVLGFHIGVAGMFVNVAIAVGGSLFARGAEAVPAAARSAAGRRG
ncbi:MAG: sodium:solute symporter family protein [Candidatus Binatia bacterium]